MMLRNSHEVVRPDFQHFEFFRFEPGATHQPSQSGMSRSLKIAATNPSRQARPPIPPDD